ncbi:MAG: 4'-phosphopantetheinyl transferase superfamily protein [Pseudomonadota bacterium]
MPDGTGLVAALRLAVPAGIALASDDPRAGAHGLLHGETLDHAVPKRLAEFAAGRRAARAAMGLLGVPASAIPHGPDRAPQWPNGVVGSISHTDGLCVALVGRSDDWVGLGLDVEVEDDRGLDAALWPEILRAEELAAIRALPSAARGSAAMAVFVAKEAVYKAQYPTSRTLIDFQALTVDADDDRFVAVFTLDVPGFAKGTTIPGRFCRAGGHIGAFCAIRRSLVV